TRLSGETPSPTGWVNQPLDPVYEWGDTTTFGSGAPLLGWVANTWDIRFAADRNYYSQVSPFTGASGTGTGPLAKRPSTCTPRVAYWATDEGNWNQSGSGGQGQLFVCDSKDHWSLSYTPYCYPHPLVSGVACSSLGVDGGGAQSGGGGPANGSSAGGG